MFTTWSKLQSNLNLPASCCFVNGALVMGETLVLACAQLDQVSSADKGKLTKLIKAAGIATKVKYVTGAQAQKLQQELESAASTKLEAAAKSAKQALVPAQAESTSTKSTNTKSTSKKSTSTKATGTKVTSTKATSQAKADPVQPQAFAKLQQQLTAAQAQLAKAHQQAAEAKAQAAQAKKSLQEHKKLQRQQARQLAKLSSQQDKLAAKLEAQRQQATQEVSEAKAVAKSIKSELTSKAKSLTKLEQATERQAKDLTRAQQKATQLKLALDAQKTKYTAKKAQVAKLERQLREADDQVELKRKLHQLEQLQGQLESQAETLGQKQRAIASAWQRAKQAEAFASEVEEGASAREAYLTERQVAYDLRYAELLRREQLANSTSALLTQRQAQLDADVQALSQRSAAHQEREQALASREAAMLEFERVVDGGDLALIQQAIFKHGQAQIALLQTQNQQQQVNLNLLTEQHTNDLFQLEQTKAFAKVLGTSLQQVAKAYAELKDDFMRSCLALRKQEIAFNQLVYELGQASGADQVEQVPNFTELAFTLNQKATQLEQLIAQLSKESQTLNYAQAALEQGQRELAEEREFLAYEKNAWDFYEKQILGWVDHLNQAIKDHSLASALGRYSKPKRKKRSERVIFFANFEDDPKYWDKQPFTPETSARMRALNEIVQQISPAKVRAGRSQTFTTKAQTSFSVPELPSVDLDLARWKQENAQAEFSQQVEQAKDKVASAQQAYQQAELRIAFLQKIADGSLTSQDFASEPPSNQAKPVQPSARPALVELLLQLGASAQELGLKQLSPSLADSAKASSQADTQTTHAQNALSAPAQNSTFFASLTEVDVADQVHKLNPELVLQVAAAPALQQRAQAELAKLDPALLQTLASSPLNQATSAFGQKEQLALSAPLLQAFDVPVTDLSVLFAEPELDEETKGLAHTQASEQARVTVSQLLSATDAEVVSQALAQLRTNSPFVQTLRQELEIEHLPDEQAQQQVQAYKDAVELEIEAERAEREQGTENHREPKDALEAFAAKVTKTQGLVDALEAPKAFGLGVASTKSGDLAVVPTEKVLESVEVQESVEVPEEIPESVQVQEQALTTNPDLPLSARPIQNQAQDQALNQNHVTAPEFVDGQATQAKPRTTSSKKSKTVNPKLDALLANYYDPESFNLAELEPVEQEEFEELFTNLVSSEEILQQAQAGAASAQHLPKNQASHSTNQTNLGTPTYDPSLYDPSLYDQTTAHHLEPLAGQLTTQVAEGQLGTSTNLAKTSTQALGSAVGAANVLATNTTALAAIPAQVSSQAEQEVSGEPLADQELVNDLISTKGFTLPTAEPFVESFPQKFVSEHARLAAQAEPEAFLDDEDVELPGVYFGRIGGGANAEALGTAGSPLQATSPVDATAPSLVAQAESAVGGVISAGVTSVGVAGAGVTATVTATLATAEAATPEAPKTVLTGQAALASQSFREFLASADVEETTAKPRRSKKEEAQRRAEQRAARVERRRAQLGQQAYAAQQSQQSTDAGPDSINAIFESSSALVSGSAQNAATQLSTSAAQFSGAVDFSRNRHQPTIGLTDATLADASATTSATTSGVPAAAAAATSADVPSQADSVPGRAQALARTPVQLQAANATVNFDQNLAPEETQAAQPAPASTSVTAQAETQVSYRWQESILTPAFAEFLTQAQQDPSLLQEFHQLRAVSEQVTKLPKIKTNSPFQWMLGLENQSEILNAAGRLVLAFGNKIPSDWRLRNSLNAVFDEEVVSSTLMPYRFKDYSNVSRWQGNLRNIESFYQNNSGYHPLSQLHAHFLNDDQVLAKTHEFGYREGYFEDSHEHDNPIFVRVVPATFSDPTYAQPGLAGDTYFVTESNVTAWSFLEELGKAIVSGESFQSFGVVVQGPVASGKTSMVIRFLFKLRYNGINQEELIYLPTFAALYANNAIAKTELAERLLKARVIVFDDVQKISQKALEFMARFLGEVESTTDRVVIFLQSQPFDQMKELEACGEFVRSRFNGLHKLELGFPDRSLRRLLAKWWFMRTTNNLDRDAMEAYLDASSYSGDCRQSQAFVRNVNPKSGPVMVYALLHQHFRPHTPQKVLPPLKVYQDQDLGVAPETPEQQQILLSVHAQGVSFSYLEPGTSAVNAPSAVSAVSATGKQLEQDTSSAFGRSETAASPDHSEQSFVDEVEAPAANQQATAPASDFGAAGFSASAFAAASVVNQAFANQAFANQPFANQEMAADSFSSQSFAAQSFSSQAFFAQASTAQFSPSAPAQAFANQSFASQSFAAQGFSAGKNLVQHPVGNNPATPAANKHAGMSGFEVAVQEAIKQGQVASGTNPAPGLDLALTALTGHSLQQVNPVTTPTIAPTTAPATGPTVGGSVQTSSLHGGFAPAPSPFATTASEFATTASVWSNTTTSLDDDNWADLQREHIEATGLKYAEKPAQPVDTSIALTTWQIVYAVAQVANLTPAQLMTKSRRNATPRSLLVWMLNHHANKNYKDIAGFLNFALSGVYKTGKGAETEISSNPQGELARMHKLVLEHAVQIEARDVPLDPSLFV